ncbi:MULTISPECIES: glycoside hydrolase family 5 protein [Anaerolinea]|uniref:glycoside hydrolase family 5 protein n=1 Tax=Anaerolinea TaxID=233189 RepID=UPI00262248CF|nr:glycoside hydrolase family 5 protein [Anaerolinea thermophila]
METFSGFEAGVNLGGWISQYDSFDYQHFETFIQEEDIARIASWGMDHIRLPMDYPVFESDDNPFSYNERGFGYVDRVIEWCQKYNLNLILDLHRAPGFSFNALQENRLFQNVDLQERFLALWEAFARRYRKVERPGLIFELMNEVVLPTSAPWNELALRAVRRIRAVDPERWIMIGGNQYNSAWTLKDLVRVDDPHIVYTFHFYEPMPFTHQKAYWVDFLKTFDTTTHYPGEIPGLDAFLARHPEYEAHFAAYRGKTMNLDMLRYFLQPAVDFLEQTHLPLYCGEYGAIDHAPLESRLNWHRDVVGLLRQHGIGRAVWSYKEMNFRLVNWKGEVESQELVEIVSQR